MKDLGNMMISYSATSDAVYCGSDLSITDGTTLDYNWYRETWYPYYIYTYPTYYTTYTCVKEDAFKKAFKIAKMLLAKKLLKSRKLKDFIGLVEMIAKEL